MYLPSYCERISYEGIGEPINVVSNFFFLLAGFLIWRKFKEHLHKLTFFDQVLLKGLIGLVVLIGLGSGIWHYWATEWAVWLDVLPILGFIVTFLIFNLFRLFTFSLMGTIVGVLGYFVLDYLVVKSVGSDFLNGSSSYFAAWVSLFLMGLYSYRRVSPELGKGYLFSVLLLTLSLVFRSVDLEICSSFPWGTHFLWHTCNAWLLYLLVNHLGDFLVAKKV
ncbi:MAG: hypothetical protein NZ480_03070 [Bdellovibrionaceae bacterium]|nr:hypothetical protein [Pseudobdellovibrionaceae bacterium]MDW8190861.1 hypothetical protein [Pseudobdellovibrionaceae bacterium]